MEEEYGKISILCMSRIWALQEIFSQTQEGKQKKEEENKPMSPKKWKKMKRRNPRRKK